VPPPTPRRPLRGTATAVDSSASTWSARQRAPSRHGRRRYAARPSDDDPPWGRHFRRHSALSIPSPPSDVLRLPAPQLSSSAKPAGVTGDFGHFRSSELRSRLPDIIRTLSFPVNWSVQPRAAVFRSDEIGMAESRGGGMCVYCRRACVERLVIFRHLTPGPSDRRGGGGGRGSAVAWPTAICFGSAPVDRAH